VRYLIILLLGLYISTGALAQRTNPTAAEQAKSMKTYLGQHPSDEGYGVYHHEFNFGGTLNTNGWDGFLEYGIQKNNRITNLFQLEAGESKDTKEYKNPGNVYPVYQNGLVYTMTSRPYIFGKQNIFYHLNLNFGQRWMIGNKGNKNGVAVYAIYMGGLTLGIIRPYYLQLYTDSTGTSTAFEKYNPQDSAIFLNPGFIAGGSGLTKGWNELSLNPGLQAKLAMRFDWAAYNDVVSAVEVGMRVQAYSRKVSIMAVNKPHQLFLNAYVSVLFGKRW